MSENNGNNGAAAILANLPTSAKPTPAETAKVETEGMKSQKDNAAADKDFAKAQAARLVKVKESLVKESNSATLTALAVADASWDFVNAELVRAGGATDKNYTAAAAELAKRLKGEMPPGISAPDSSGIGRYLGYAALARLIGRDEFKRLPLSWLKSLITLTWRDKSAPGLEFKAGVYKEGVEIAYSFGNGTSDWDAKARALIGKCLAGDVKGFDDLTKRMKKIRVPGKGRGTAADAETAKTDVPENVATAAKRIGSTLKTALKDVADDDKAKVRAAAVKEAVKTGALTVSDLVNAVKALAAAQMKTGDKFRALKSVKEAISLTAETIRAALAGDKEIADTEVKKEKERKARRRERQTA